MHPRHFMILAAVAAGSLLVAVTTYLAAVPWSQDQATAREPLMPALAARTGDLAKIEISRGENAVQLANQEGTWVLASGEGYPADSAKVRELILAASEAALVERKTAKASRHDILGLKEPSEAGSSARLLRFLDQKDGPLGEIVLGNPATDIFAASKGGTYVRRPGDDQTWLADREITASLSLRDWVQTKLIDFSPSNIKAGRIETDGEPGFDIKRTADGKYHELTAMPAGKKLKYVNSVDELVEAASLIEFRKVRKAGKADSLPLKGRVTLETETGLKPVIEFRADSKEAWVRITATGPDAAKSEIDALTQRTAGWEFEVPMSEVNASLAKLADLLEDAPA